MFTGAHLRSLKEDGMTANNDFKRLVRQRMSDTGESYTQARELVARQAQQQIEDLFRQFRESEGD